MNIEQAQLMLQKEGFYHGRIDGEFGPMSMSALFSLQKKKGVIIPQSIRIAAGDLWIKETAGEKTTPRIAEYHKHTALQATEDEIAWCSSAMNCWMNEAGLPGTNSAAARSWLVWGRKILAPQFGCVTILKRGNSEWEGHVAFYLLGDDKTMLLLGGNQSNSVCVAEFNVNKTLGFRVP